MSLVLDGTLQGAQDGTFHKPIVEILSESTVADIPFAGQILQETTTNETKPNVIMHSSGRLCAVYTYGTGANNNFQYVYTDVNRTQFYWADIDLPVGYTAVEATLCEMADGNIGIILYGTYGGNEKLRSLVLSVTGAVVTAQAEVYSVTTATHILQGPFVSRLDDDSYILVYVDKTISGLTYYIRKRTSSDFSTWSAEGTCSIGGLTATKRIQNPHLLQISTDELWCWFDYLSDISALNELINVYYSTSADRGVTWANGVNFTNFVTYDTVGMHPVAAQKIANQMHLVYTSQSGALHMDRTEAGWCGDTDQMRVSALHFDPAERKIYCVTQADYGTGGVNTIVRVDIDTWTLDACWNTQFDPVPSVPALNSIWHGFINVEQDRNHSHGHYVGMVGDDMAGKHYAFVLDADADTITQYNFQDNTTYGLTKNIEPPTCTNGTRKLLKSWIDADARRFYLLFASWAVGNNGLFYVGYIDLTETGPMYTLNELINENGTLSAALAYAIGCISPYYWNGDFQVFPSTDEIVVSFGWQSGAGGNISDLYVGELRVYSLSTGALVKSINLVGNIDFPRHGLGDFAYVGRKIYGTFFSCIGPPEEDPAKSGLCIIDLDTDVITYSIPTYATFPGVITYIRQVFAADSSRLLVVAPNMAVPTTQEEQRTGVAVFDMVAGTWKLLNNTTLPGMDRQGWNQGYKYWTIAYDPSAEWVITGNKVSTSYFDIIAFDINGLIHQPVYSVGTYALGAWTWTAAADFVQGYSETDAVIALENSDRTIYSLWVDLELIEYSMMWAKEGSTLDVTPYLIRGSSVAIDRSIDGSPAALSFSVSSGHLFDPHNTASLYSIYLKKGRKLTLRLGETIGGTAYWQNQSVFYVIESSLSYERLIHPEMSVKAEDIRTFWDDAIITATEFYETTPQAIIEDLLDTWAGIASGDMVIPVFANSTTLYHQWVEVSLRDTLDHICNRYGYFMRIDADGKVSAKRIDSSAAVDHAYTGTGKIIRYSPDDKYSDFTNQIVVTGESRNLINVLFAEEPIKTITGTVGWWGGRREITVYYSEDRAKKCTYPRLEVLLSVRNFNFKLGGGRESITYEDGDLLYCVITIDTPDLVAVVVAMIAAIVALGIATIGCDGWGTGWCSVMIMMLCSLLSTVLGIMASVANYSYQLYAQPYGQVKQTVQATWNDYELQASLNFVNLKKLTESLCYTIEDCQVVADHEGDVVRLQRNQIRIVKIGHLQDEEGDIIQIEHPYSGKDMKLLIAKLTRRITIADVGGDGSILDEIEAWKI